jgi:hypothetical protein
MVKKARSDRRWKEGRLSIRIHGDLRDALEFLAERDHRALSNYVERALVEHAQERLANNIGEFGDRRDDRPWTRRIDYEGQFRGSPNAGMRGFPTGTAPKKR